MKKLSDDEKRMKLYLVNYEHNEPFFLHFFEASIAQVLKLFEQHRIKQTAEVTIYSLDHKSPLLTSNYLQ